MKARLFAAVAAATMMLGTGVAHASDDPDWDKQYGPQQIYAPEAWSVTRGADVTIAIIDSGIQLDHPDLRDKIVSGYDFLEDDDEPQDTNGHGTHVAGTAAAITDNGVGIAGVAPDSKIMPVRVLAGEATSPTFLLSLEQGMRFAYQNGAKVLNLSLGEGVLLGPEGKAQVETGCAEAFQSGALCIVAAGNDGRGKASGYRNDLQGILVAANGREGNVAPFSQKADTKWGVTAPGVGVYSTWLDSGYHYTQGTSMAAPHVSGVAALLFSQGLTNQQVVDKIIGTATPLNDGGGTSGAGLVNAAAAVGASYTPAPAAPTPTTTTTTSPTGASSGPSTTIDSFEVVNDSPVVLEEGLIEDEGTDGDVIEGSSFEAAVGDDVGLEPISQTDGFTASFLLLVAAFIAGLGAVGFVGRRIVLRRGIGEIRT